MNPEIVHQALAGILSLLSTLFPWGGQLVGENALHYQAESPIVRQGTQYMGYAEWDGNGWQRWTLDRPGIALRYADTREREIVESCTAVHEAAHLRYKVSTEELPLLAEIACLTALEAPRWMIEDRLGRLYTPYWENEEHAQ